MGSVTTVAFQSLCNFDNAGGSQAGRAQGDELLRVGKAGNAAGGLDVKIKAAGGISSLADAEEFIRLGASRLGTSRIVKLAKAMEKNEAAANDGSY